MSTAISLSRIESENYGHMLPRYVKAASIATNLQEIKFTPEMIALAIAAYNLSCVSANRQDKKQWATTLLNLACASELAGRETPDADCGMLANVEAALSETIKDNPIQEDENEDQLNTDIAQGAIPVFLKSMRG